MLPADNSDIPPNTAAICQRTTIRVRSRPLSVTLKGRPNGRTSAVSSVTDTARAVTYLISIAVGKRVLDMLDMVVCASGAFGAFRRTAVDQVGVMTAGPGED